MSNIIFDPPLQISYSSLELFNTCERKLQLTKLLENDVAKEEYAHFSRGHSFGTLVQQYLLTGDPDYALFKGWLAYWPELDDQQKGITQSLTLALLDKLRPQLDLIRLEWEVAIFDGKPAIELSFKLEMENFSYVGFIDLVLRNKITGMYAIGEIKTTSLLIQDIDPLYKNSSQGVIYSAVLDQIAGEELAKYQVLYFVMQDVKGNIKFHVCPYTKTLLDRLQAFYTIGIDTQRILQCEQLGIYPRRGSKCISFNRTCRHFGTCTLQGADKPVKREPNPEKFQFVFQLEEIIDNHLRRVKA
jgi:hypothetical protein